MDPQGIVIAKSGKENKGEDLNDNQPVKEGFHLHDHLQGGCQDLPGGSPGYAFHPTASGKPQKATQDHVTVFEKLQPIKSIRSCFLPAGSRQPTAWRNWPAQASIPGTTSTGAIASVAYQVRKKVALPACYFKP
jgi:hypothetical protein